MGKETGRDRLSFPSWLGLALLFIGLPTGVAIAISYYMPVFLLHNPSLANYLGTIIPLMTFVISSTYFNRYIQSRGLKSQFMRRTSVKISPESGKPIDQKMIKGFEASLKFAKGEDRIRRLVTVGMMYLQNAVAYDDKDRYLKAKEFLSLAEEAMRGESPSFETKMLVENLRSKTETYKYRFGDR
ncbi:hypothetical protein HS1genome_0397 [Sulfodiicoccus acidiphilus]|uniref:Uncharacterized protein n=1 Tax=Sulfodiicoccus acidiphilus TaxID=1670455 RepID=A0A348B1F6_9CREN|nr:hypothetical protein [Sulfodiicoccus acidiphilus]BBD72008.1 hypothetical protein HS1genome_0397 [Sulfodiicoccus acidiphilus]GGT92071.1 hypothetical protein GCM10007116_07350 [Sulfodiicoccus acidiphilus]